MDLENAAGTLSLIFRARCACGIWKDLDITNGPRREEIDSIKRILEEARAEFEAYCGWTDLDTNPTCARCSEVESLKGQS